MRKTKFHKTSSTLEGEPTSLVVLTNSIFYDIKDWYEKRYQVNISGFEKTEVRRKTKHNKLIFSYNLGKFVDSNFPKLTKKEFFAKLKKEVNENFRLLELCPELKKKKEKKKEKFSLSQAFKQDKKSEEDTKKVIEGIAGKKS